MPPDSSPTAQDNANDMPENANEPGTELTVEQEQEFINETLGLKSAENKSEADKPDPEKKEDKPDDPEAEPDTSGAEEDPADPNPEEQPDSPEAEPEPKAPEEDKPTPELDENGIDVSDLWVEVENSEGKSVKLVFDPANPNSFLPDDFTFKNDKQLFEILDAKAEMANIYKERNSDFEQKQEVQSAESQKQETIKGWDSEINALKAEGILADTKPPKNGKEYTPEEVAADPTLQEIDGTFKLIAKSYEDGKPIGSFGAAHAIYTRQEAKKAEAVKAKEEAKLAKARGAIVGGSSAASAGEKKAYRAGSYGSIYDVPVSDE